MAMKGRIITFNCDFCGKEKKQSAGNYNRTSTHFCSRACAVNNKWKGTNKINKDLLKEEIFCKCGCGEKLYRYVLAHNSGSSVREREYIVGHTGNILNSGQFKGGETSWNKGIPVSDETKQKLSKIAKEQWKDGVPIEHRIKVSCGLRKISVDDFDGFARDNTLRNNNTEVRLHAEWRKKIFAKDDYTCQLCYKRPGNGKRVILNAHHIKHWNSHEELRRDLNNGVTLCRKCHGYVHSKKYKNELKAN